MKNYFITFIVILCVVLCVWLFTYLLPYLIVLGVIIWAIVKIAGFFKKNKIKKTYYENNEQDSNTDDIFTNEEDISSAIDVDFEEVKKE